eukprot:g17265.t1
MRHTIAMQMITGLVCGFVHFSPKSRWKKTHLLQLRAPTQQLDQTMAVSTPHQAHTSPNTCPFLSHPTQQSVLRLDFDTLS